MRGECNLFDVEILVDITVEFTSEDGLIILDSVKWYGVELVEMIDQHEMLASDESLPSPLAKYPLLTKFYAAFKALVSYCYDLVSSQPRQQRALLFAWCPFDHFVSLIRALCDSRSWPDILRGR